MNKDNKKLSLSAILMLLISFVAAIIVWLLAKYDIMSTSEAGVALSDSVRHLLSF